MIFKELPEELIFEIWSYDDTIINNYNKSLEELNNNCKERKSLMISISDYISLNNRNDLKYILNKAEDCLNSVMYINYLKNIKFPRIEEHEIYYDNDIIKYNIYYINYPNL